jgi:hypothetical protein
MDVPPAAAVAAGSSLLRQSSSPAGFLNHLNMDNGSSLYHYHYSFLNSAFFWYYPQFLLPARRRARPQLLRLALAEEHFFLFRELNPCQIQGTRAC